MRNANKFNIRKWELTKIKVASKLPKISLGQDVVIHCVLLFVVEIESKYIVEFRQSNAIITIEQYNNFHE